MLYQNTPSSSIPNLVLYPRSAFKGKIIFVLESNRSKHKYYFPSNSERGYRTKFEMLLEGVF